MGFNIEAFVAEQELLPGLPDAVVIHFVVRRLPWYTRPRMLAVSKGWREVLQNPPFHSSCSPQVAHPAGLLLVHELLDKASLNQEEQFADRLPSAPLSSEDSDDESSDIFLLRTYTIAMYDPKGGTWHRLPPIPSCPSGIPSRCSFICIDGKLFVMGGVPDSTKEKESSDMHMLNLGMGLWWWEKCASMHFSRAFLKCAALGGRIYVVGGTCPAEVYDVGENYWQRLPEMLDFQFFCDGILALENQIYAYGYDILDPEVVFEPDVNSARVYDVITGSWSSTEFDFSKCCTAVSGRLLYDMVDGTLITYDVSSQVSTVFDGKLQVDCNSQEPALPPYLEHGCRTPICEIHDLIAVDIQGKPPHVYTLASQGDYRLRTLWRGTLDCDAGKVSWEQIKCPFRLGHLDSEHLSELCYMH